MSGSAHSGSLRGAGNCNAQHLYHLPQRLVGCGGVGLVGEGAEMANLIYIYLLLLDRL